MPLIAFKVHELGVEVGVLDALTRAFSEAPRIRLCIPAKLLYATMNTRLFASVQLLSRAHG